MSASDFGEIADKAVIAFDEAGAPPLSTELARTLDAALVTGLQEKSDREWASLSRGAPAEYMAGSGEAERGLSASPRPESADATGSAVAGEASPPAISPVSRGPGPTGPWEVHEGDNRYVSNRYVKRPGKSAGTTRYAGPFTIAEAAIVRDALNSAVTRLDP